MLRVRSVQELIKLLNQNKNFINTVFESTHRQININNALGIVENEILEELEENNLIEIYQNEVLLSESFVKFLEAHLIDSFDEELYDYKNIFLKISKSIDLYYISTESNGDIDKHLRAIHRHLRRIPNNLLDSLKSLQRHVEFTYRSAATNKEKLEELKGYNQSLDEFYKTLDFISNKLKEYRGFFQTIDNSAIEMQRTRLGSYVLSIRDTLISLTQTVIDYIKDTERSIHFHKHITELKELSDRKEIRSKTNIYDLVFNTSKDPLLSGFTKVEKKNTQIKFYPDYAYEEEFVERYKSNKEQLVQTQKIEVFSEPIDEDYLSSDEIVIVNYSGILYEYLEQENYNKSFLDYLKQKEPDLQGVELLTAYLDTIISNAEELTFTEDYEEIAGYDCVSAYPLSKEHEYEGDYT